LIKQYSYCPLFLTPFFFSAGDTITLHERTINKGNIKSGSSVTRYYLSDTNPIDLETAYVVGEREIDALQPGEQAPRFQTTFIVPAGLPEGMYFLKACADAERDIIETYEDNNCSNSGVFGIGVIR